MKASPRKKLLSYSMSACSFIALSSSVKAQIVYTDIDTDRSFLLKPLKGLTLFQNL